MNDFLSKILKSNKIIKRSFKKSIKLFSDDNIPMKVTVEEYDERLHRYILRYEKSKLTETIDMNAIWMIRIIRLNNIHPDDTKTMIIEIEEYDY